MINLVLALIVVHSPQLAALVDFIVHQPSTALLYGIAWLSHECHSVWLARLAYIGLMLVACWLH